ncbi:MAG TPA: MBL fold metallo-hydrolase [Actinoplanes sp.]|nr:MBL fold metallo-hydrolase [Actinoplanes sp.]
MDVVEVLPELVMFRFPVGHAYLWRDPSGLTLIDTGVPGSARSIAAALDDLGHRIADVRRILLTHYHVDHTGSAAEIATWGTDSAGRGTDLSGRGGDLSGRGSDLSGQSADLPGRGGESASWGAPEVYAHRLDAPMIRGAADGPPPILVSEWERELFAQVHAAAGAPATAPPVQVDHELDDGDEIDLGGGVTAVCVAAPGHTPGSVAFHLPGPGLLFPGDTIARGPDGTVMLGVFNYDPPTAAASLRKQAALAPRIACFGHGDPLTKDTAAALAATAAALPPP